MTILAAVLAATLTRAEIIDRFRAVPLPKVKGLVQVIADCPSDMRSEYQSPVANFVADVCNRLYAAERRQPDVFKEPGIIVYLGDVRTNDASVVVRPATRGKGEGSPLITRLFLPAPGYTDVARLRVETVRAFFRAVKGEDIDDARALEAIRAADPELKADYEYDMIDRWLNGESVDRDDEEMLKLCRSVLVPGVARESDVLRFGSRLRLYPETYDRPFCGKYHSCSFKEAIALREVDPRIRLVAYLKAPQVVLYGGGRGESLNAAAEAYSKFLLELASNRLSEEELKNLLEDADIKFNIALEECRVKRAE